MYTSECIFLYSMCVLYLCVCVQAPKHRQHKTGVAYSWLASRAISLLSHPLQVSNFRGETSLVQSLTCFNVALSISWASCFGECTFLPSSRVLDGRAKSVIRLARLQLSEAFMFWCQDLLFNLWIFSFHCDAWNKMSHFHHNYNPCTVGLVKPRLSVRSQKLGVFWKHYMLGSCLINV